MGRMRENPRYNVISMRISDDEKASLESLVHETNMSVSDIMREAMNLYRAHIESLENVRRAA